MHKIKTDACCLMMMMTTSDDIQWQQFEKKMTFTKIVSLLSPSFVIFFEFCHIFIINHVHGIWWWGKRRDKANVVWMCEQSHKSRRDQHEKLCRCRNRWSQVKTACSRFPLSLPDLNCIKYNFYMQHGFVRKKMMKKTFSNIHVLHCLYKIMFFARPTNIPSFFALLPF